MAKGQQKMLRLKKIKGIVTRMISYLQNNESNLRRKETSQPSGVRALD